MKYYAFLWQRPIDKTPWPAIYISKHLAETAPGRISEVVEVELTEKAKADGTDRDSGFEHTASKA